MAKCILIGHSSKQEDITIRAEVTIESSKITEYESIQILKNNQKKHSKTPKFSVLLISNKTTKIACASPINTER